jgi:hypothetical protein
MQSECGDLNYYIYSYPLNSSIDSSIFTFTNASRALSIQTDDPDSAGRLGIYQTTYPLIIEAYMGIHFLNKASFKINVTLKDYCWVSTLIEDPRATPIKNVTGKILEYT